MRRCAGAAALLVALVACGGSSTPKSIERESARVMAHVTVRVRGDITIDFDQQTPIVVFRTLDERIPEGVRLFSVGMPDHVEIRENVRFRAAFDVLSYRGDGDYVIKPNILGRPVPGLTPGLELPSGIQSNAFVELIRFGLQPPFIRYGVALEACTVRAADGGREGSLSCPKLRLDEGFATISLEMTWKALTR